MNSSDGACTDLLSDTFHLRSFAAGLRRNPSESLHACSRMFTDDSRKLERPACGSFFPRIQYIQTKLHHQHPLPVPFTPCVVRSLGYFESTVVGKHEEVAGFGATFMIMACPCKRKNKLIMNASGS